MQVAAKGKRAKGLWRGVGVLSTSLLLGLLPLASASAAPTKKPVKTAAKAAPKAAPKTPAKASAKAAPKSAAKAAASQGAASKTAASKNKNARGNPGPAAKAATQTAGKHSGKATVAKARGAAGKPILNAKVSLRQDASNPRARDRANRVASASTRMSLTRPTSPMMRTAAAPRLSMGHMAGLHGTNDPLDLRSSVALVMDQDTNEVLFSKNDHAVLPIASLTKLMTGLIVSDARLPLDELITITHEDVDTVKGSSSRLPVGTTLTRGELMHLALMSSENRAAHALGRTFPGGLSRFVALMNARAIMLGMKDTRFVEPTGLSSANRSSAHDLATLVATASQEPLLRQFSTSQGYEVAVGSRMLQYGNTNRLVHHPDWQIGLQKTGYISEAGRCLVMQAHVGGRNLIMVFLDAHGKQSRLADAERVRRWVENERPAPRTVAGNDYSG